MSSKGNTDIGAETHLWKQRHILIFADCLTFNFDLNGYSQPFSQNNLLKFWKNQG